MSRHSRTPYVFALILGLLCWSTVPIFIKFLNEHLGNFTQNLYRYIAACALLWSISLFLFRRRLPLPPKALAWLLLPTAVMCGHQLLWVASIKLTTPTTAALLTQFQVVIVGLLAWFIFRDERTTILSPRFLLGALLALFGVAGFILAGGKELSGSVLGCAVVLITAVAWAAYTISVKVALRGSHPVVAFTYVSTGVLFFFCITTPLVGDPARVLDVPFTVPLALAVSGFIGIALAHLFYYTALSHLSAAVCGTATLIIPVLTGIWSFLVYRETLAPLQVLFGLLLLAGATLTLLRPRPSPAKRSHISLLNDEGPPWDRFRRGSGGKRIFPQGVTGRKRDEQERLSPP